LLASMPLVARVQEGFRSMGRRTSENVRSSLLPLISRTCRSRCQLSVCGHHSALSCRVLFSVASQDLTHPYQMPSVPPAPSQQRRLDPGRPRSWRTTWRSTRLKTRLLSSTFLLESTSGR